MPPTPPTITSSVSNRKGNGGGIKQALEEMTARFDTGKYY
jgi:hypothetical protein